MKKKARYFIWAIVISLLFLSPVFITISRAGTETLISTNTTGSDQQAPAIYGNWIVWEDSRNGGSDIYGYNIITGEERRITPVGASGYDPSISGNLVTWQDFRDNTDFQIFSNDLSTGIETQITNDPWEHSAPAIDGNNIVWQDKQTGTFDIYEYNLLTHAETLITPGASGVNKEFPAISGNLVVWQDYRNGAKSDIFMNDTLSGTLYDLSPGTITSNQMKPVISGSKVVWKDERVNTFGNITLNDTSTWMTTKLDGGTPSTVRKNRPAIYGTTVVWIDNRNNLASPTLYDIYMNDVSTGLISRITTPAANILAWPDTPPSGYTTIGPAIYGNRIVWTDHRNGDKDIFLYTDGITESCPVANFSVVTQSGLVPLAVQFMDTTAPGVTPVSHWHWEFGDGNISTQPNPSFTYTIPGTKVVRLTVDNPYCRNETPIANSYNISVGSAPIASFTVTPGSGFAPLPVAFTDSSLAATSWNWSFGDGSFSDTENPSHTFTNAGSYTVLLNASNTWGYSDTTQTVMVLTGANITANTTIDGITITNPYGSQFLNLDTAKLPLCTNTGSALICTDPALSSNGWTNITFLSADGIGFQSQPGVIRGNLTGVIFKTNEINLAGFSKKTGTLDSINYSISLPTYPVAGTFNTQIWESAIPDDLTTFSKIATMSNFQGLDYLAYTIKIVKNNIPSGGSTQLHMSVNSSWVAQLADGRNHTYLVRITDDRSTGEVLPAHYLTTDTVKDLDYFEIDSPHGSSTFGLSLLSGSGNPLQLITLSVASHTSSQSNTASSNSGGGNSDSSSGAGAGAGTGNGPAPANAPELHAPPVDPGKTGKIYSNVNGVISQATVLASTDNLATISLGPGIVAKDSAGNPLSSITLAALPPDNVPGTSTGSAFMVNGLAYEITPDGATFSSPGLTLTFTIPQAQWGQEYSVKTYDRATGTWQDLPSTFEPSTGELTAHTEHLCRFAVFAKSLQKTTPVTIPVTQVPATLRAPEAPPSNSVTSIFTNLMVWMSDWLLKNSFLIIGIIALVCCIVLIIQWKFR
jgi:beta propeller repeat protein